MSAGLTFVVELSARSGAADDVQGFSEADQSEIHRRKWQKLIDFTLVEWGRNPSLLEDDGVTAPTLRVINWAVRIAHELARRGVVAPTRVVSNCDGGIVFERANGTQFETLEIDPDGTVYCLTFSGNTLVGRYVWKKLRG